MKLFDVNILIYAHREDQTHHAFYRGKLEGALQGHESVGLSPLAAAGFVRIVTHPGFPNGPTPLAQALAVVEAFLQAPNAHWVLPGRRHWEILSMLCRATQCRGKLVADAQHAAIAIEHACVWVSRDEDFNAFQAHGLRFEPWRP